MARLGLRGLNTCMLVQPRLTDKYQLRSAPTEHKKIDNNINKARLFIFYGLQQFFSKIKCRGSE